MSIGGPFDAYPPGMWEDQSAYRRGYREGYRDGVRDALGEDDEEQYYEPKIVPLTPYNPDIAPSPWADTIKCSRCRISFGGVTGYVCSDNQCPTFIRASY